MSFGNFRVVVFGAIAALALSAGSIAAAQDTTTSATPAATAQATPAAPAAASEEPAQEESATTSGTIGEPPAGKGMVVFFRPMRFVGAALAFTTREGETILGSIGNGRYIAIAADPGVHSYNIRGGETIRIEVEPGETYYLQLNIAMGLLSGRGVLAPSDKATFEAHPLQPSRDQAHAQPGQQ
ncbi:MAG: hypothetical protein HY054_09890 [Proteobacteria bacterium]|nr:hypothetical protein [Pseudomonadota bacterium]